MYYIHIHIIYMKILYMYTYIYISFSCKLFVYNYSIINIFIIDISKNICREENYQKEEREKDLEESESLCKKVTPEAGL